MSINSITIINNGFYLRIDEIVSNYYIIIIIAVAIYSGYLLFFIYDNVYSLYDLENGIFADNKNVLNTQTYDSIVEKKEAKQKAALENDIPDRFTY